MDLLDRHEIKVEKILKGCETGGELPDLIDQAVTHHNFNLTLEEEVRALEGLKELAKAFNGRKTYRSLRFVAFANEEPPHFQYGSMGSLVYAKRCRERNEKIVAMLSLETIGFYSEQHGSQHYPFPVGFFYPSTANFIAFVGNISSCGLVHKAVESFRRQVQFPSEGGAWPGFITGVGWSDHWAFWQMGSSRSGWIEWTTSPPSASSPLSRCAASGTPRTISS